MESKQQEKKVVATIEARMSSARLPGKVLKKIGKFPSLELQVKRMRKSIFIDEIVIATTNNKADDSIENFCNKINCKVFRGSENNVMERILHAAQSESADIQVQITGDCPLIDSEIIDDLIKLILSNQDLDFVSNEIERSFPIGLDCRVFKVSALEKANKLCKDHTHRVHGSTFMYIGEGKKLFKSKNILAPKKLNFPNWRWTLDTNDDLKFFRTLAKYFNGDLSDLNSAAIVEWLELNPEIAKINQFVKQKALEEG